MIRHRPVGSGHPYSPDTEQRWPVHPVGGEPLRLGVRTSGDVAAVQLELRGTEPVALSPVPRSSRGQAQDGGHLASAQARQARKAGGWQIELPAPPAGEFSYRFVAQHTSGKTETTRWYATRTGQWRTGGRVQVEGDAVPLGPVSVLDDGERIRRVRFSLPLAPGERVVGFGERYDALDQRGLTVDNQVFEQYKSQGRHRRTYLPMPFAHVIGGTGWGFHLRTNSPAWFDLTGDAIVVEAVTDLPSDTEDVISLALYRGTPEQVLDAFVTETGRATELPDWVFKLWASGNEWNTQAEVTRQVELHARHGIPIGNVVIEAWSDERTFTIFRDAQYKVREDGAPFRLADFTFPPDGAWPDPKGMVDWLHDQGIRLHLWQIPLVKLRPHPTGQVAADAAAAIREGVLIQERTPDGKLRPYRNRGWWFPLALMPDLTDERAAAWWTAKRAYLVAELGIDGFKTDGGEHAWGEDLVYLDGRGGAAKNNTFPREYAAAYARLLSAHGKAPVTFSRAGYTGSGAYGAVWAGDENSTWEAFRWSMLAGLNASACGVVYWGWDIAGFSGPVPDPELYVRAMAASAFVPIMQYHSEFNHHRRPPRDRTPWNVAELTGDDSVIGEVRRIVEVRERLVPYLYEQAGEAVRRSRPLMRPLFFEYGAEPGIWEHPVQWLLGDHLLVAPVLAPGAVEWPVYVPEGRWVNAWTGAEVAGGQVVHTPVPRYQVPVYVRADHWEALGYIFG